MDYVLQKLDISNIDMIKDFYVDIFTNEPCANDNIRMVLFDVS